MPRGRESQPPHTMHGLSLLTRFTARPVAFLLVICGQVACHEFRNRDSGYQHSFSHLAGRQCAFGDQQLDRSDHERPGLDDLFVAEKNSNSFAHACKVAQGPCLGDVPEPKKSKAGSGSKKCPLWVRFGPNVRPFQEQTASQESFQLTHKTGVLSRIGSKRFRSLALSGMTLRFCCEDRFPAERMNVEFNGALNKSLNRAEC